MTLRLQAIWDLLEASTRHQRGRSWPNTWWQGVLMYRPAPWYLLRPVCLCVDSAALAHWSSCVADCPFLQVVPCPWDHVGSKVLQGGEYSLPPSIVAILSCMRP